MAHVLSLSEDMHDGRLLRFFLFTNSTIRSLSETSPFPELWLQCAISVGKTNTSFCALNGFTDTSAFLLTTTLAFGCFFLTACTRGLFLPGECSYTNTATQQTNTGQQDASGNFVKILKICKTDSENSFKTRSKIILVYLNVCLTMFLKHILG